MYATDELFYSFKEPYAQTTYGFIEPTEPYSFIEPVATVQPAIEPVKTSLIQQAIETIKKADNNFIETAISTLVPQQVMVPEEVQQAATVMQLTDSPPIVSNDVVMPVAQPIMQQAGIGTGNGWLWVAALGAALLVAASIANTKPEKQKQPEKQK